MKKYPALTKVVLVFLLIAGCIAIYPESVDAQDSAGLTIDVWTNKGGQGQGVSGGSYQIGEQVVIYVQASVSCQSKLNWQGPAGTYSRQLSLQPGQVESIPLKFLDVTDMGTWQVKVEAQSGNQIKTDMTSFVITVTPQSPSSVPVNPTPVTPTPAPEHTPTPPPAPQPPVPSPPPPSVQPQSPTPLPQQSSTKPGPGNASELQALMAQKITEGLLTGDPNLDVNGDGKITTEDVMAILLWSVGKERGESSQSPSNGETTPEPLSSPPVLPSVSAPTPGSVGVEKGTSSPPPSSGGKTQEPVSSPPASTPVSSPPSGSSSSPAASSSDAKNEALVGKWQMNRLQLKASFPEGVPDFVINITFPEKSTWTISRDSKQMQIKYDGRDTWYKKTLLGKAVTESATTTQENANGVTVTFLKPAKFYMRTLPFPLGILFNNLTQIQGSFTSTVVVTGSGDNLKATASIGNVKGTYMDKHKDGRQTTESIHFSTITATYQGIRK